MMKANFKKVTAMILALVLVFGLLPGGIISARAAETDAVKSFQALKEAIQAVTSTVPATIVIGDDITFTETLAIRVGINIIIRSEADAAYTLTQVSGRHFEVKGSLTLADVVLVGGGTGSGGGISVLGTAQQSPDDYEKPGSLTIEDGVVIKNCYSNEGAYGSREGGGGAVYVNFGSFTMNGGELSGNEANGLGGGVFVDARGSFYMNGGTISGNLAVTGGGVAVETRTAKCEVIIKGGTIKGNYATDGGGLALLATYTNYIYMPGMAYPDSLEFRLEGGTISGNTATGKGGGIYNCDSYSVMDMPGNPVHSDKPGTQMNVSGGSVVNNTAANGGGVYLSVYQAYMGAATAVGSSFNMNGGIIGGNTVTGNGGGVYAEDGTSYGQLDFGRLVAPIKITVTGGAFIRNSAPEGDGGAIYVAVPHSSSTYTQYQNLTVGPNVVFDENSAQMAYPSAENANTLIGLTNGSTTTTTTSVSFALGSNPMNNYDVNYTEGTALSTVAKTTGKVTATLSKNGEKFVLAKNVGGETVYYVVDSTNGNYWTNAQENATHFTVASGKIEITGLYLGSYALIHVEDCVEAFDFELTAASLEPTLAFCLVTFDSLVEDFDAGSQLVLANGKAIEPDPNRSGWVVTGWYKDADLTEAWDFDADTVTADTTLYAAWEMADTFAVTVTKFGKGNVEGPAQVTGTRNATYTITPDKDYVIAQIMVDGILVANYPYVKSYSYTLKDVRETHIITVVFEVAGRTVNKFTDVKNNDWYASSVDFVTDIGLFSGVEDDVFGADTGMNRAMFVTLLYRMANRLSCDTTGTDDVPFTDVKMSEYYGAGLRWAVKNKLINGKSETIFGTEEDITREEMATLMIRFVDYLNKSGIELTLLNNPVENFLDQGSISDWAESSVMKMAAAGLVQGNEGYFNPIGSLSRAETATLCMRLIQNYDLLKLFSQPTP